MNKPTPCTHPLDKPDKTSDIWMHINANIECGEPIYIITLPEIIPGMFPEDYNKLAEHEHEYHPRDSSQTPQCRWRFRFGDHIQGLTQCPAWYIDGGWAFKPIEVGPNWKPGDPPVGRPE